MDPNKLPIVYQQLFDLPKVLPSLSPSSLTPASVAVGDRYICVRDNQNGNVNIIDLQNWSQPATRTLRADSTIMHPTQPILAVRAGGLLQVFLLTTEPPKKLGDQNFRGESEQDKIEFWKWIDEQTIAFVTSRSVFHWTISLNGSLPNGAPQKIFDRAADLAGHTITNYEASYDKMFYALSGTKAAGRVTGTAQLYSAAQGGSQPIPAHACCFSRFKKPGLPDAVMFCFVKREETGGAQLFCIEMGGQHKPQTAIQFPDTNLTDYPISLVYSPKYSVLYMLTNQGLFFMFDSLTAKRLMANKVSPDTIFLGAPHVSASGVIGITSPGGAVLAITVHEANMVPWILNQLNDQPLAISLAQRGGLPGLEGVFSQQFQLFVQSGQYAQAAKLVAESPRGCLRTPQTIQIFKSLPSTQTSVPLRDYFTVLLDYGQLNEAETMELVQPVVAQRRADLINDWLSRDKLFCSSTLGRLVLPIDSNAALKIFEKCGDKDEIAKLYVITGDIDKLVELVKEGSYKPDWMALLLNVLQTNPQKAQPFAKMLLKTAGRPLVDANAVVDAFLERNLIKETTSLLLEVIENTPEFADLQTRILEINIKTVPHVTNALQIVNALFDGGLFSHYDHQKVATWCEAVGMYQRALQHFKDIKDVRNVLVAHGTSMPPEFVTVVFQRFSQTERFELLKDLLAASTQTNTLNLVSAVALKFTILPPEANPFPPLSIVKLFEEHNSYEGSYLYLRLVVGVFKDNHDITYKFIEAATKLGLTKEVEKAVVELEYDAQAVREFLKENRLDSQLPLILLCNRHNFVADLTNYLYRGNMISHIESFVLQINPLKTPEVVGVLLDENCPEEKIKTIITSVGHLCPVGGLVAECEGRGRLLLLRTWLEQRYNEANKEPATHTALAKILISSSDERAETFLLNNDLYEQREVGRYAEEHNPGLALKIYQHHKCHMELINLTNRNGMFREQAQYLVYEQSPELWAYVLKEDTDQRKQLIDQVINSTLPEIKPERSDVVSSAVQAFMVAKLPQQLMELLEKIVIDTPGFSDNRYLQNLLILTAIKAQRSKVMDYVTRLNQYDPEDIAGMSLSYKLPEVAFTIYKKFEKKVEAMGVLVNSLNDLERASDFADECRTPAVYSALAQAQLEKGFVTAAIQSYLKASDGEKYEDVIAAAKKGNHFEDLVKYLTMCRTSIKSPTSKSRERVDSELAYALAKTKSADLDIFVNQSNHANIPNVGEICFKEGLYDAARILYFSAKNYPKLVSCLIKLQNFTEAVEFARKAGLSQTWKEICRACLEANPPDFQLAQISGGAVVNNPGSDLEEVVGYYEEKGFTNDLMTLLEAGLNTETTINLSTTLAILYSRYKPEKLYPHLQLFKKKLTIAKVVMAVKENQQWKELSYLYELDNDLDKAAGVMIEHPESWIDLKFKELIGKVKSVELLYDSVKFYLNYCPSKTVDLLFSVAARVDPSKVVVTVKGLKQLPLIKKFLESVQEKDVREVNHALNDLYIEEEDFESLRNSVSKYQNFDSVSLAKRLEGNELLEFKRIASHLYKLNKKWKQSIELSKHHKLYQDAMETAAESKDAALAEELLRFFVEPAYNIKSPHCFSGCLYACYDLLKPDVVLELAWRYKMLDFAFPYLIQYLKDSNTKLETLTAALAKKEEEASSATSTNPGSSTPQGGNLAFPVGPSMAFPPGAFVGPPGMMVHGAPPGGINMSPVNIPPPGMQMPPMVGGMPPMVMNQPVPHATPPPSGQPWF